jgi:putative serine protease PepD
MMPAMNSPKAITSLLAAAVLGAAGGAAVVTVVGAAHTTTTVDAARAPGRVAVADAPAHALSAAQVYAHAKDSVAYITASVQQQSDSPFGSAQQGQATGSGFVVSAGGLVVTNAHVVEGASTIQVKVGDGSAHAATVVGRDVSHDVALLKVDTGAQQPTPLALADSSAVEVGDPTYAIGNPFGLDRTLTTGVVSALQRQISAPNGFRIDGVIQTDASINPGNSGGPLLNAQGEVIGIDSQIATGGSGSEGSVGIGFAIPANTVRTIVAQLEHGAGTTAS